MDLKGIHATWSRTGGSYFISASLDKIKGKEIDIAHLISYLNVTRSDIKVKEIVEKLMKSKSACLWKSGPAISDMKGNLIYSSDMDRMLCIILENLYKNP